MILSIDQSTNQSGWFCHGKNQDIIDYGIIDLSHLPKKTDQDQAEKRYQLLQQLKHIIYKLSIESVKNKALIN